MTPFLSVNDVTAVVLAGGASRRMGEPKAQLRIGDTSMLGRILGAVERSGIAKRVVVGGDPSWTGETDPAADWIADAYPGEGPLGGLVTALDVIRTSWILLLSCDLVSADPKQLLGLLDMANSSPDLDAVVPHYRGKPQLFHALYRRNALDRVSERFGSGERRLRALLDGLRCLEIPAIGDLALSVRDVDTPQAFRDAMREH